jgi:hypothetical protein
VSGVIFWHVRTYCFGKKKEKKGKKRGKKTSRNGIHHQEMGVDNKKPCQKEKKRKKAMTACRTPERPEVKTRWADK